MGGRGAGSGLSKNILYRSDSGAIVRKNYEGKPKEEAQNLAAAKIVADKTGMNVDLLYNDPNKKTADAMIHGELWEIKTNTTPTLSAIDSAVKNAKGQARQVILHIQSDVKTEDAVKTVKHRLERSGHFDRVLVITKNSSVIMVNK